MAQTWQWWIQWHTGFKGTKFKDAYKVVALVASEQNVWVFFRKNIHMGSTFFEDGVAESLDRI